MKKSNNQLCAVKTFVFYGILGTKHLIQEFSNISMHFEKIKFVKISKKKTSVLVTNGMVLNRHTGVFNPCKNKYVHVRTYTYKCINVLYTINKLLKKINENCISKWCELPFAHTLHCEFCCGFIFPSFVAISYQLLL